MHRPQLRWLACLLGAVVCAVGGLADYAFFVRTATGQRLDNMALVGSQIGAWRVQGPLLHLLQLVSTTAVALVIVTVMAIALARRRWILSLEAAAVVVAANVTTHALKWWIFTRPDLVGDHQLGTHNTLPSGHTTVAASAAFAAVLVVPVRLRPVTAFVGAVGTFAFGYATLVGHWHRPSDVVAGILVSAAWAYLALATGHLRRVVVGRSQAVPTSPPETGSGRLVSLALSAAGLVALVGGVALLVFAQRHAVPGAITGTPRLGLFAAYAGGSALAVAAAALTMAVHLGLASARPGRALSRRDAGARPASRPPR